MILTKFPGDPVHVAPRLLSVVESLNKGDGNEAQRLLMEAAVISAAIEKVTEQHGAPDHPERFFVDATNLEGGVLKGTVGRLCLW